MMPSPFRAVCHSVLTGSLLALAACSGVGQGIAPVSSSLQPLGGVEGAASTRAYTCLNTSITLIVTFSNGARGDFSSRGRWTSSNPAVAQVSNGDLPVPEQAGSFFGRGVVVPVAPGTTTISVSYLDFSNSIDVTIADPTNFKVVPAEADVAVGAGLDLALSADLDGIPNMLDNVASWSFVTPNTSVATIDAATGVVTGVAAGGPLMARGRIAGCSLVADSTVNVSPLSSLALSKEFTDLTSLVVGTTERITATGTLANGKTQDLSASVTFASSDSASATFLAGTLRNLVFATRASAAPVQLTAAFGTSPSVITSPTLALTPIDGVLANVLVTPANGELAPGRTLALTAIGEYASGARQPITRHVTWSSADSSVISVLDNASSINPLAGLAQAATAAETGKSVVLTATNNNASTQKSATATLVINPAAPPTP